MTVNPDAEILLDPTTYAYPGTDAFSITSTIKKGTIITLLVRLAFGVTDKPGVRP